MGVTFHETVAFDWKTRIIANPDLRSYKWDASDPNAMAIDSRLRLIAKWSDITRIGVYATYRNFVAAFAEITNDSPKCIPSQYTDCGFLPIGVEPDCMVGKINNHIIIPKLVELGLEYFLIAPISPVSSSYKPIDKMASSHDVWVNKLEAAKVVTNKPPHNITTLDLLEVILPL